MDPDIAGCRLGEHNTQRFSSYWPGDDISMHPMVTSVVNMTNLTIVNAAIARLPDPRRKIRELWWCWEEPNGGGGLHASNVTPIFDNNTAAQLEKLNITVNNLALLCVLDPSEQANGTSHSQMPMLGGHSYRPQDDIVRPPAEDLINDIGEKSNNCAETWRPCPRSFLTLVTDVEMFERELQTRFILEQEWLGVGRDIALWLFADYEWRVVAVHNVAWLLEHDSIVNPRAAGSLANWKRSSSHLAAD